MYLCCSGLWGHVTKTPSQSRVLVAQILRIASKFEDTNPSECCEKLKQAM